MNIFNLSFGKDSMATLILAAERGGGHTDQTQETTDTCAIKYFSLKND